MLSEKIAIASISAGFLTPVFSNAIDIFFETFITKKDTPNLRETIKRCLLSGCVVGWLIAIIYYAFALTEATPIRMIITYSICLGIVAPILSKSFVITYSKLFSKREGK